MGGTLVSGIKRGRINKLTTLRSLSVAEVSIEDEIDQ